MDKVAIVVLADTETHADLGRLVNALMTADEFREHRATTAQAPSTSARSSSESTSRSCATTRDTQAFARSSTTGT
ncbi:MAG TPA: hypothetical protein VFM96_12425, partial [Gaiellaceae bacterium]|nr:hypothetical protein [Gaiellaceae bacterium]